MTPLFNLVLFNSQIDCRVHLIWYVKSNWVGKKCPHHPEDCDWWRREVVSKLEFRWTCLKWRLCWFFLTSTNGMKISSEQIRPILISYCHKALWDKGDLQQQKKDSYCPIHSSGSREPIQCPKTHYSNTVNLLIVQGVNWQGAIYQSKTVQSKIDSA